jgi:hypothetical protein
MPYMTPGHPRTFQHPSPALKVGLIREPHRSQNARYRLVSKRSIDYHHGVDRERPGPAYGGSPSLHWRTKSENVPIRVHDLTFMLVPFRVYGHSEFGSCSPPRLCERVSIVNPEICHVLRTLRVDVRHDFEVDLDAVTSHESVSPTFILRGVKTKSLIMRQ